MRLINDMDINCFLSNALTVSSHCVSMYARVVFVSAKRATTAELSDFAIYVVQLARKSIYYTYVYRLFRSSSWDETHRFVSSLDRILTIGFFPFREHTPSNSVCITISIEPREVFSALVVRHLQLNDSIRCNINEI